MRLSFLKFKNLVNVDIWAAEFPTFNFKNYRLRLQDWELTEKYSNYNSSEYFFHNVQSKYFIESNKKVTSAVFHTRNTFPSICGWNFYGCGYCGILNHLWIRNLKSFYAQLFSAKITAANKYDHIKELLLYIWYTIYTFKCYLLQRRDTVRTWSGHFHSCERHIAGRLRSNALIKIRFL